MIPADFPWRPGMLYTTSTGARVRLTERGESVRHVGAVLVYRPGKPEGWPPPSDADPVLSDAATIGALAGAVREAWGDPTIHVIHRTVDRGGPHERSGWIVCRGDTMIADGPTEGAAWLAAWSARPRSTP